MHGKQFSTQTKSLTPVTLKITSQKHKHRTYYQLFHMIMSRLISEPASDWSMFPVQPSDWLRPFPLLLSVRNWGLGHTRTEPLQRLHFTQ